MAQSGIAWYEQTERRVLDAQKKIRDSGVDTPLIDMVDVDDTGIHWNEAFRSRYSGMTRGKAFVTYVKDLERVARGVEDMVFIGDLFG